MKIRDHLFALCVHAGILACIVILVLATSCEKPVVEPEPDPVGDFFREFSKGLDKAGAESVALIAVIDNADAGENTRRQVRQEIQSQLNKLKDFAIIDQPEKELTAQLEELSIDPEEGISPEKAINLAKKLNSGAIIYASIESSTPDVFIKVYSGETGEIVFAETLQAWELPVSADIDPLGDLPSTEEPMPSDIPEGQ